MLTDAAIRALRPGIRAIKKADGNGLFILVTPDTQRRDMMRWWSDYLEAAKRKGLSGDAKRTSASLVIEWFELINSRSCLASVSGRPIAR